MWLVYGKSPDDRFVHISESGRGGSGLCCPYCGGALVAKKGNVKVHHFSHVANTCREVEVGCYDFFAVESPIDVSLSLYEFAVQYQTEIQRRHEELKTRRDQVLSAIAQNAEFIREGLRLLEDISRPYKAGPLPANRVKNKQVLEQVKLYLSNETAPFPDLGIVRYSKFEGYYEYNVYRERGGQGDYRLILSDKKIYPGDLWLSERERNYSTFVAGELREFLKALVTCYSARASLAGVEKELLTFEQAMAIFNRFRLYFLKISGVDSIFYKIGITGREVSERLKEIHLDLKGLGVCEVEVLLELSGFGFVESYFKQKYKGYRFAFGSHTEYFSFPVELFSEILRQLFRLSYRELGRMEKIVKGMQLAKAAGKHVGRPGGEESAVAFLSKPLSVAIAAKLAEGLSLRAVVAAVKKDFPSCSINTVRKVAGLLKGDE